MGSIKSFSDYLDWLVANQNFLEGDVRKVRAVKHPGFFLRRALKQASLTQTELARKMGCTQPKINEILQGRRGISPAFAIDLEKALDIPAEAWLSLQSRWDLSQIR